MELTSSIRYFEEWQQHRQAQEDLKLCLITIPKHQQIKEEIKQFLEELK